MKSKDGDGVVFRQCEKVEISRKKLRTVRGTRYAVRDEVELKGALGVAAVVEL
jgi:hypothetical protein